MEKDDPFAADVKMTATDSTLLSAAQQQALAADIVNAGQVRCFAGPRSFQIHRFENDMYITALCALNVINNFAERAMP